MQTYTELTLDMHFLNPELDDSKPGCASEPWMREALLDFDPEGVGALSRRGDSLVLLLKDGRRLTIRNFFPFEERYQQCLDEMRAGCNGGSVSQHGMYSTEGLKYNFSQPATALVFSGSALLVFAIVKLLL